MIRRFLLLLFALFLLLQLIDGWRFDLLGFADDANRVVERARSLAARARPEYPEHALATLPENPFNGPFLRFDLALAEAEVERAPERAPGDEVSTLFALEFEGGDEPAWIPEGMAPPQRADGVMRMTASPGGYLVLDGLDLPRDEIGQLWIRMRTTAGTHFRLGWQGEGSDRRSRSLWRDRIDLPFRGTGEFHTYVIDARNVLKRGLAPGEHIRRLLVQPADVPGAVVEIDWIRILGPTARYVHALRGSQSESLAEDTRPVLFMWPDQSLAWEVTIPQQAPRFDAAVAVLRPDHPVGFALRFRPEGGEPVELWRQEVGESARWQEIRIDLAAFAGQKGRLLLEVSGPPENVALWASPLLSSAPRRPLRIVMVVEDAERAASLSLYGHDRPTTPFKERLAAQAVVFAHAFSQATKTRPSIASLMTGLYPSATGLWHFSDVLAERHLTLAEILRAQGYVTGAFVQNGNAGPYAGLHQGFDSMRTGPAVQGRIEKVTIDAQVFDWLERHRDRNLFLYLHVLDPHAPYDPPEDLRQAEEGTAVGRDPVLDPEWVERPTIEGRRQRYEAEIRHNDRILERFFAMLEERGLAHDTLFVLTADHGEFLGERGLLGNRLWDHRPPGYGWVTRVPLMLVWPAGLPQAKRIDEPVGLVDLVPTLLEAAGVERSGLLLHGDSLWPLMRGEDLGFWQRRVVVSEEPTAMRRSDPCASCGSLVRGGLQLLGSPWIFKRDWLFGFDDGFGLLFTHLRAAGEDGIHGTSLVGLFPRWLHRRTLAALHEANIRLWRQVTGGEAGGTVIEPTTLEQLRGLGYVQ
ncbi:Arylsulfatase [bacterium HR40]|nr:Arylsulfatase [bacterium HR40]